MRTHIALVLTMLVYLSVFLYLMLCPAAAEAEGWTVHTLTVHGLTEDGLNNANPGVARDFGKYRAGVVYNSYEIPAVYGVRTWEVLPRVRFAAGLTSGYRFTGDGLRVRGDKYGVIPLVAAEVDLTDHVSLLWFGEALNLELKF